MNRLLLITLPYGILCLLTLVISLIWWPVRGGLVQLTNSWIGLFFICAFCAVFLFQEDISHFLEKNFKNVFSFPIGSLQKEKKLPEILKDNQKFREIISGTVMAWMEKVNLEKEEKKLHENDISQILEQYQKSRQESIKWLFLFADNFLVQHSKDILYEIYERHYVTEEIVREIASEMAIVETELEAILEILKFLKFIKRQENEIIITETGSAYCTYLEYAAYKK
jgi:hypothetical protein